MRWSTACPDWEQRIVEGRSLIPLAPLFPDEAETALAVFKSLRAVDVAGSPRLGEIFDEWVFDFVRAIFGAYDQANAKRLITEFLLLISKKNAKSLIAAGIMVTALVRNWRSMAELLILAPTLEVANNSFSPAAGMVRADEELSKLLHIIENQRIIRHRVTRAELKVIAADADVASGKKAGFVLVEELWLFGKKVKSAAMLREATGGLAARPEGFIIYITTHSDEPPAGVFKEKLEYFRDVRDGVIDDRTSLAVLYEWPKAMLDAEAYLEPENFYVTNPNLDKSVSRSWLESELQKALRGDGEGKQIFLAKHLNVEIGLRTRRDRWLGADYWEGAADTTLTLEELLDRSEVAVMGVDGGGDDDLLGVCVIGRERQTKRWLAWFKAFCFAGVLELRKDIAANLIDFERKGDLVIFGRGEPVPLYGLTDNGADDLSADEYVAAALDEDVEAVVDIAAQLKASGLLPEKRAIGLDPEGVAVLVDALGGIGLDINEQVVGVPQGYRLNSSIVGIPRKLKNGSFIHNGAPMMNWVVSNAKAERAGNAMKCTKQMAGSAKIDPLIAGFTAAKLMELNPTALSKPTPALYFV